nr:carboxylesterase family protein [Pedobacter sp. ASV19]
MKRIILTLLMLFPLLMYAQEDTLVRFSKGIIKGLKEGDCAVFKGIPYAQPPVGQLRFRAPKAYQSWADTLDCTKFGSISAQYNSQKKAVNGSEDCLSLNVYQPLNSGSKLPVVVWIHGGGMTGGSGSGENGHSFSDQDSIVTVTINYRLGVMGFLYLGDVDSSYHTSGNNAVLDCIMALKWVKENIQSFGGDPERLTIMGQSAGAKLVSALSVTPLAKGLFQQIIAQSGSVQCIRDTTTAKAIRARVLKQIGLHKPAELLNLSTDQLLAAQDAVCGGAKGTNYFGPVEDGLVFTSDPYACFMNQPKENKRFLIGTNKFESTMFMNMDKRLYKPDKKVLKDWFGHNFRYVLKSYHRERKKYQADSAAKEILTRYMYTLHSYRLANAAASLGYPIWVYRFDYSENGKGATHGGEMPYVWSVAGRKRAKAVEYELAQDVHKAWSEFIKGRSPGHIGSANWTPYEKATKAIMIIGTKSEMREGESIFNDVNYPSAGFISGK